jgi:hypothetical protein
LASVYSSRTNQDADGVTQRNDQPIDAKVLASVAASTKVYIESARQQRATKTRNFIMDNIPVVFKDILDRGHLSVREIEECVREGLDKKDEQEFGRQII